MSKFELLAPAGNLEKLKTAVIYGANAVFIGGKKFSLRSMASNFSIEEIKEGCDFAHAHNAKIHVTCNIVMHETDTDGLVEYLKQLAGAGVDAIICSSVYVLKMVKEHTKMEAHVSTQQSSINHESVKLFKSLGADRVVLGRELSLEEIKQVKENVDIEIETFIHGGMCASYAGRCVLSNIMTNRDANRGGCAHSCRWNYELFHGDELLSKPDDYFQMSSKDLCAIRAIPTLMDIGVNSFKIEGRMKSLHYIATVVSAYRHLIDEYEQTGKIEDFTKYETYMDSGVNRDISTGFLFNRPTIAQQLYDELKNTPEQNFVAIVRSYDKDTKIAVLEERNFFLPNHDYEVLSPRGLFPLHIEEITNSKGEVVDAARHAQEMLTIKSDVPLEPFDLIR